MDMTDLKAHFTETGVAHPIGGDELAQSCHDAGVDLKRAPYTRPIWESPEVTAFSEFIEAVEASGFDV